MDKSQLRRLALDYAHGNLRHDEYVRQRADLLDDIVAGRVAIERETAPEPVPDLDVTLPSMSEPRLPQPPVVEDPPAPRATLSPLHMGVGAALLVLVLVAAVWLFSAGDAPPPPAPTATAPPPPAVSPARELVESFVADRDFSELRITRFQERWSALSAADVDEARGAPWFRRLVTAVVQEVKTQKALADLDGTGAAVDKARRLVAFGRFLGISERMLPDVATATLPQPAPTAAPAPEASPPAAGTATPPSATETVTLKLPDIRLPDPATLDESPAAAPPVAVAPPPVPSGPRGRDWLHQQPVDAYTLQLFALNHLEKVERLIARHPGLELHLVDYAPVEPRYRVLHGSFDTPELARRAYEALPDDVRSEQPRAFIRSFSDILADEPAATTVTAPAAAPAAPAAPAAATASPPVPASAWLLQQPRDRFTLQLFASNSRDNALRVVQRFPDLALALHESDDARSRFRVLYGSFSTAEEAKRAFGTLPTGLAEDAGLPLVKSIGELQDSGARATAN